MSPDKKVTVEDALETIFSIISDFTSILEKDMNLNARHLDRMTETLESFVLLKDVVSINCEPSEKSREEALASVLQIDWFDLLVEDPAKFDRMKKTVENNSLRLRLCGAIEEKLIADVDLSGVDLSGSVFKRCHFNGCNFHNSKLHFVTFDNSYLTYCSFVDADLEGMKIEKCTVQGLNLDNARMKGSKWLKNAITDTPLCFEQDDKPTVLDNIVFNSGPKQYLSSTGADKSLQEKIESLKKRINEL